MPMYTAIKDSIYRLLKPGDLLTATRLIDLAVEIGVSQQTVGNRMTRLKITGRRWSMVGGPSTRNGGAATVLAPEECDRIRRDFAENPAGKGGRPKGGGKPKREREREPKRVGLPAEPAKVEPPEYVPEDDGESVGDFDSPGKIDDDDDAAPGGTCSLCLQPVTKHKDGEACWHPTLGTDAPAKIDDDFTGAVLPIGIDGPPWQAAEGWAPDTGPEPAPVGQCSSGAGDHVSRSAGHATLTSMANSLDQVRIEVAQLGAALKRPRVRRPNLMASLYCSEGMHPRRLIIWIDDVRILGATRIVFGDGFVEAYTDGGDA